MPEDITVIMPSQKQAQKENNLHPLKPFDKERFQYDSDQDEYICPEGKRLKYVGAAFSSTRKRAYKAAGKDCRGCPHFAFALPSETEEGLSAWQKNRSKSASKIGTIALRGKKYTACENKKWNYPLVT